MILTKFNFSTLTLVTLLTLSLNVFSTGVCTPDTDELSNQSEITDQIKIDRAEGNAFSTNEEYMDSVNDNIDALTTSSDLNISAVTGESLDEAAALTTAATEATTEVVEAATLTLGEVLGPIGIVVTAGLIIYNAVTVFNNPNSTDFQIANAAIGWLIVGLSLYDFFFYESMHAREVRDKFFKELYAVDHLTYYKATLAELRTQEKILAHTRIALEGITNKDVTAVEKIMLGTNKRISKVLTSRYRNHITGLQTHIKQLFGHQWVAASPIFLKLIDFFNQSNSAVKFIDTVVQDNQWHHLSDIGRTNSTRVIDLHKLTYKDTSGNDEILKIDAFPFKSSKLDNTWFIGSTVDSDGNFAEVVRYLVITLRNTPNQEEGVQYSAQLIFAANTPVTLVNELSTTEDFIAAGWTAANTADYTVRGLAISHPVRAPIPSIISGQTVQLCGISQRVGGFLMNKTAKQISHCLGGIFQDYKNHFGAYKSNDTIKVKTRDSAIIDVPLNQFVNTYGKSYNHLVAHAKIKTINQFYDLKKSINTKTCKFYAKNVQKFLRAVKKQMYADDERLFQNEHNLNSAGQSKAAGCWKTTVQECGWEVECHDVDITPIYKCDIIPYVPSKDILIPMELSRMQQQAVEEEQNCLAQKDSTPLIFAKELTAQGNFYLDESDSGVLFEAVFEGVKKVLLEHFVANIKSLRRKNLVDNGIDTATYGGGQTNNLTKQWATSAIASSQFNDSTFSATRATGAPTLDVVGSIGVDVAGAWAEAVGDRGKLNTLTLTYDTFTYISKVVVRENFNAGTISKIEALNGESWEIIYSTAGGIEAGGVKVGDEYSQLISDTTITLNDITVFATDKIRITTGKVGVVEYNEIDAVKLIGLKSKDKLAQWMTTASASSQFNRSTFFATQAIGAPTLGAVGSVAVDVGGAWAEAVSDRGKLNTIVLGYQKAVNILQIIVRESFHAGTISKVEAFDGTNWKTLYAKTGSTETGGIKTGDKTPRLVSDTKITLNKISPFATDKIRITTGQVGVMQYNEIDAVKVIGLPDGDL